MPYRRSALLEQVPGGLSCTVELVDADYR
jgi:hypothetical protein